MSIRAALLAAVQRRELWPLQPEFPSDPVHRTLLLHAELHSKLMARAVDKRLGRLWADLEMFVKGEEISVSLIPYEHKSAYMGLLAPEALGNWEIRSRDPSPGIRVFGRFACQDIFVALHWALRSRSDPRWPDMRPLGDRNSLEYQLNVIETEQRWEKALPNCEPLAGTDISELLSNNYNCV